ncbi:MAG: hypothetical protein AW09_004348 [Candidatus Accumulibacter phosphatis]|uniref:Uncharacterized protein n=1 Tax=Candidatus Accumulibacter phosphatis TaxID=327160 RepID=A0A080M025_9PROT|nr:MAG: hypothetical protein AW09_004348 [Candidatus Accumulibacter phosphatis]
MPPTCKARTSAATGSASVPRARSSPTPIAWRSSTPATAASTCACSMSPARCSPNRRHCRRRPNGSRSRGRSTTSTSRCCRGSGRRPRTTRCRSGTSPTTCSKAAPATTTWSTPPQARHCCAAWRATTRSMVGRGMTRCSAVPATTRPSFRAATQVMPLPTAPALASSRSRTRRLAERKQM